MWCGCLDVVRGRAVNDMRCTSSLSLAVRNTSSPKGWSQKWAHELSTAANCSKISTSKLSPACLGRRGSLAMRASACQTRGGDAASVTGHRRKPAREAGFSGARTTA